MDNAFCTINNQTYSAHQFSRLDMATISHLRRFLQCPSCGAPAFFRKASRSGQAACFGARPHYDGCTEGAPLSSLIHGENCDENILHNDGQRIVLDLNYGAARPTVHVDDDMGGGPGRGSRFSNNGNRPNAVARRRLSTILRSLVQNPDFRNSEQTIEINGTDRAVCEFFVHFSQINQGHINQFHGYWGAIADVGNSNGTLWLNSGGRDDVSLCLPPEIQPSFFERFGVNDAEDLVGVNILYLGHLKVSQNNKKYIVIDELALVTCY